MSDAADFGDAVRDVVLGEEFGFGAEDVPRGTRGKARSRRGLKRPGQWGWQARARRFLRLFKAETRAACRRDNRFRGSARFNRRDRRRMHRRALEQTALTMFGIAPLPGEPSADLRERALRVVVL